jgi:hypothetical protein
MPKRYDLNAIFLSKDRKVPIKCAKCKSDNITLRSRRTYFIKSSACLIVILFCYLLFNSLRKEDIDSVVIIGVLGSVLFSSLSLVLSLYYFLKGILTKETSYKCEHCKNQFKPPLG